MDNWPHLVPICWLPHLVEQSLCYTKVLSFYNNPFVNCWPYFSSPNILFRKLLPVPMYCSVTPIFSFNVFVVLGLALRSSIHSELICIPARRYKSTSILPHADTQVFWNHLLKTLPFWDLYISLQATVVLRHVFEFHYLKILPLTPLSWAFL